ncbi:MAG: hypothetical protein KL863_00850 [Rhizobium sp.]|jgi:hypothetical protein|nr:hypothetical protein [Rhizobium sp.]
MQISSSLHSYENAPKTYVYDRRTTPTEQQEDVAINRRDDAITGSQTVLSSSLAEALWSIQRGGEDDASTSSAVESLYLSYSE